MLLSSQKKSNNFSLFFRAMPPGRRFQEDGRKRHVVNHEENREDSTRSYCTRQGVGRREPRHDMGTSRRWSLETSRKGRRNEQSREVQPGRKHDFSNKYRRRQPCKRRGKIQEQDRPEPASTKGADKESGSTCGILLEGEMRLRK